MGIEIWGRQLTTRGAEIGVPKRGVILAAQNEPKLKVSRIVYLHAGIEIRSAIPHAIHWESNEDSQAPGFQTSACHLAW